MPLAREGFDNLILIRQEYNGNQLFVCRHQFQHVPVAMYSECCFVRATSVRQRATQDNDRLMMPFNTAATAPKCVSRLGSSRTYRSALAGSTGRDASWRPTVPPAEVADCGDSMVATTRLRAKHLGTSFGGYCRILSTERQFLILLECKGTYSATSNNMK